MFFKKCINIHYINFIISTVMKLCFVNFLLNEYCIGLEDTSLLWNMHCYNG